MIGVRRLLPTLVPAFGHSAQVWLRAESAALPDEGGGSRDSSLPLLFFSPSPLLSASLCLCVLISVALRIFFSPRLQTSPRSIGRWVTQSCHTC